MARQSYSLLEQLELGVRYFDFQVSVVKGIHFTGDGLYCQRISDCLSVLATFLAVHPKEIVLINFTSSGEMNSKQINEFADYLLEYFKGKLCPVHNVRKVTLNAMWENKQQLIVFFEKRHLSSLKTHFENSCLWSSDWITVFHPKLSTLSSLLEALNGFKSDARHNDFEVVIPAMTPDLDMVFGVHGYHSMRHLAAETVNKGVKQWLRSLKFHPGIGTYHIKNGHGRINIVAVDFVDADIVNIIIVMNTSGYSLHNGDID